MLRIRTILAILGLIAGLSALTACNSSGGSSGGGKINMVTVKGTVSCGKYGDVHIKQIKDLAINRRDIHGTVIGNDSFTLVVDGNHFKTPADIQFVAKIQCGNYDVVEKTYKGASPQITCNYNSCKQASTKPPKAPPAANAQGTANCRGGGHPATLKLIHGGWNQTVRTDSYNPATGAFKGYVSHRTARGYELELTGCGNTKKAHAGPFTAANLKVECYKGKYTCKKTK